MVKYLNITEVELLTGREALDLVNSPDLDFELADLPECLFEDMEEEDFYEARFIHYQGSIFDTQEFARLDWGSERPLQDADWGWGLSATYFSGWVLRHSRQTPDDPYMFEMAWYQE